MGAQLETTDKVALLIAALLIIAGFIALLAPQDLAFGRATNFPRARQQTLIEHITSRQSRVYGLGAIGAGAALCGYVVWASRTP